MSNITAVLDDYKALSFNAAATHGLECRYRQNAAKDFMALKDELA